MSIPNVPHDDIIPPDIYAAALDVTLAAGVYTDAAVEISKAILAERERCAKISDEWRLSVSSGFYDNFEVDEIGNTIGPNIATAIRGNFESGANAAANSPALESAAATRTATTEGKSNV